MKTDKKPIIKDILLICALLIIGFALMALPKDAGARVEVRIDGKLYAEYPLHTDRLIGIEKDGTHLGCAVIEQGEIYMKCANCKEGDCIKQGKINRKGQCILCLPQGIGIYVVGEGELDGVTG